MRRPSLLRPNLTTILAALAALPCGLPARASDHADPIMLQKLEAGITDLFVFPARDMDRGRRVPATMKGEPDKFVPFTNAEANRLVIVFCVRRALSVSPPYEGLEQFTYRVYADLHSATDASFRDADPNLARYGGTAHDPEGIGEDFVITLQFDRNARLTHREARVKEGGAWKQPRAADRIQWHSGVHDDPFIFPQFFGTNVVATVVSVPLDCFPSGQQHFLFWGASHQRGADPDQVGAQIDHVGRSQRTQLPRFDFLNTVHPRDHVRAIVEQRDRPGVKDDFLRTYIPPPFNIRPYDLQPDVMFFTRTREPKYPNGRQLEDDVAALTCQQGDCQLFELSQSHAKSASFPGGRPTKNDKEFSATFPYLADPWPDSTPSKPPELTARTQMILIAAGVGAALFVLGFLALYLWTYFRLRRVSRELAALKQSRPALPVAPAPNPTAPRLP